MRAHATRASLLVLLLALLPGCVRRLATNAMAGALAGSGDAYASDDDPQLVREALPFALKTYESVLAGAPEHEGLLVATAAGFTQYAYGFLVPDAERIEGDDLEASLEVRRRARRLLLRARDYGLRALELEEPGLTAELRRGETARLAAVGEEAAAALFWSAAAWGGAIAVLKDDPDLLGDLSAVKAMLERVLALDERFLQGGAHEVMVSLEAGLVGGSLEAAKRHFERAVEIQQGRSAGPFVTYAETVAVKLQERALFLEMLDRALAVDPDGERALRLANRIAQERARRLRARADELFVE